MSRNLFLGTVSAIGLSASVATYASAEVPNVAADIAPVHSLVSMVMGDLGTPNLLVQPGASPHGYSMRPSEAKALNSADLVVWVGEGLEPWLEGPLQALAAKAHVIELMEVDGATELDIRKGATFEAHDHDEDHDDHEDHHDEDHNEDHAADHDDHEEHDDHDAHEEDHDDNDEAHHDDHDDAHDDHAHHGHDPHGWLDPQNAQLWLDVIATELAELDPENAATYRANAEAGKAEITAAIDDVTATLAPVRGMEFVVFHDAYHYFENRFAFPASGSIRVGDSSDPSPARIQEIHDKVQALNITCAFAEPQFNERMIQTVFRGTNAKIGVLDPQGANLETGAALYPQLIRDLGQNLADCLSGS